MLFISFYDKHRLVSLRFLRSLKVVIVLSVVVGFFHIIITGLFIDSQRTSAVNGSSGFFENPAATANWSIIAFALGFLTIFGAMSLLLVQLTFRTFFREERNCVITTVNDNSCKVPVDGDPCGVGNGCEEAVRKLVVPGKLDNEGNLHVLLRTDEEGKYVAVRNDDPLYDHYHWESLG